MNGKDFISVLEYMKAFNKPPKASRRKKDYGDIDLVALLHKKQEELALFEHWMKQQDKLRKEEKKEEKKEHKPWISIPQLAFILVASFPITAPMYVAWIKTILH
jgi:hypothetical protein